MGKEYDKVSIITTVRNEEKNISLFLDSILRQTYKFEEVIINDNGSTDNTIDIIRSYQKNHNSIKLLLSRRGSIGEGRNTAIENSCGDILAIMDSGLYPKNDWLEKVVDPLLMDPNIDVAWGNVIYDTQSRVIPTRSLAVALVFITERSIDRRNLPSSAFRRRVWENLGRFPITPFRVEDLVLIDMIKNKGFKVTFVDDAIAYYFAYPASQYEAFNKWMFSACSAFIHRLHPGGFFRQLFIYGIFFLCFFLVFIDIKFLSLLFIYVVFFFANRYRLNKVLGKRIFRNPKLSMLALSLFIILNVARLIGVLKALKMILTGNKAKIKIID